MQKLSFNFQKKHHGKTTTINTKKYLFLTWLVGNINRIQNILNEKTTSLIIISLITCLNFVFNFSVYNYIPMPNQPNLIS